MRTRTTEANMKQSKRKLARNTITKEMILSALSYAPSTGEFTWVKPTSRCVKNKTKAGNQHRGYVRVRIFGVLFPAHELAWFVSYGEWPMHEIDHINGNGSDNRIENLRDVTHAVNGQNQRRARVDNKLGKLGVIRYQDGFAAKIMKNGKTKYLGKHKTPELAHAAYLIAKREMHEGCSI